MKQNILEEIKKIQEMMGVNPQILVEASVNQEPWFFNMVDDFIKKLFKDDENYQEAWRLLEEYKKKKLDYGQLTPAQKAKSTKNDPDEWRRGLSDEQKKLLKNAETIEGIKSRSDMDTLWDITSRGKRLEDLSDNEKDFLNEFVRIIFNNRQLVDDAVESFYKMNPKATVWEQTWKKRKLSEFNSEASINDWSTRLKSEIDNEQSIPDYLKEALKKEIDIASNSLKDNLTKFNETVQTPGIKKLLKAYNVNYKDNILWYDKIFEFLAAPLTGRSKITWGTETAGGGKKVETKISTVLKELFELSQKNPELNFEELVDLAFTLTKYKGTSLSTEESLKIVEKLYPTYMQKRGMQEMWEIYVKENPRLRRFTRDDEFWSCFKGFRFPKTVTEPIQGTDPVGVKWTTTSLLNILEKVLTGNKDLGSFRLGKCGWVPVIFISYIVWLILDKPLGQQLEVIPEITILRPIAGYLGIWTNKMKLDETQKKFPEIFNIIYKSLFSKDQLVSQLKDIYKDKFTDEDVKQLENSGLDFFDGIYLKYQGLKYTIVTNNWGGNRSEFNIYNITDKTLSSLENWVDNIKTNYGKTDFLGEYNAVVGTVITTETVKYSDDDINVIYDETKNLFNYKNGNNIIRQYVYDVTNNTAAPKQPTLDDFKKALTSATIDVSKIKEKAEKQGYKLGEHWKGSSSLSTDCSTDYGLSLEQSAYFVKKCNDNTYSEKYLYNYNTDKFTLIGFTADGISIYENKINSKKLLLNKLFEQIRKEKKPVEKPKSTEKPKQSEEPKPVEKPKAEIQPPSSIDWKKYSKTVPITDCYPDTTDDNFFKTHYKEEFRDKASKRFLKYYSDKFGMGEWGYNGRLDGQCDEEELMAMWRAGKETSDDGYKLHEMSTVAYLINEKIIGGKVRGDEFFEIDKLKFPNEINDDIKESITKKLKMIKENKNMKDLITKKLKEKKHKKQIEEVKMVRSLLRLNESFEKRNYKRFYNSMSQFIVNSSLNESIDQTFKNAFSVVYSGFEGGFKEKYVDNLLSKLNVPAQSEIGKTIKDSLMSTPDDKVVDVFFDCNAVTKTIVDAIAPTIISEFPTTGGDDLMGVVQNVLTQQIQSQNTKETLMVKISQIVCPVLTNTMDNVKNLSQDMRSSIIPQILGSEEI
jgi:hypothetical protein